MPTPNPTFESLKMQFAEQNDELKRVFGALESLHPSHGIAVDPQLLQAIDAACNATFITTTPARVPMGIRA